MIEPDRPAHDAPLEALLDGYWAHAASARCFVVEHSYPLEYVHGGQALAQAHAAPREAWAPFLGESDSLRFDACRAVLLDIETTGLARGAGTFAFMVGVGLFDGNRLIVRQYFAPDYADEEALLDLLARDLDLASGLITFNGRSFDWPILETRYTLVHRSPPARVRRTSIVGCGAFLWRRRLVSCALGALEQRVLGIMREQQDVPGYLILRSIRIICVGDTQPLGVCLSQPDGYPSDGQPNGAGWADLGPLLKKRTIHYAIIWRWGCSMSAAAGQKRPCTLTDWQRLL
jgi:hypothetical protein